MVVIGLKISHKFPKIAYVGGFLPFFDHTPLKLFPDFLQDFPQDCPQHFRKNFPQEFPTRFSCKNFPQDFPARFPTRISQDFLQDFPRFSRKDFPARRFSARDFPQDFPARFSCKIFPQDFPKLDPDWLAPHHPIPNAKFPPITALLNRPTYHKSAKVSPPPFPQISWEPQINE